MACDRCPTWTCHAELVPFRICIDARKSEHFGIGTYVTNLVRSLARIDQENEYWLLVRSAEDPVLRHLPENFHPLVDDTASYSIKEQFSVSRRLREIEADLYHSTHYVLPISTPCRCVVTIHDVIHLLFPQFLPNRLAPLYARSMIRRSLRRAERIIAVSHTTRDDLRRLFPRSETAIDPIHNGVESCYRPPSRRMDDSEVSERLGGPAPYVLFVGNPKPHKNLPTLLRAFAAAADRLDGKETLVCVGGPEGGSKEHRELCRSLGIDDRVRFLPKVDETTLSALYAHARLFCLPTLYEGFGLP